MQAPITSNYCWSIAKRNKNTFSWFRQYSEHQGLTMSDTLFMIIREKQKELGVLT